MITTARVYNPRNAPFLALYPLTSCRRMSFRILRATRKIAAGDALGETNFHEDFKVVYAAESAKI